MARARNIKPSLLRNELLGDADPLYTILFAGLWMLCDREGRMEDRPKRIKADIFPYRDLSDKDVGLQLQWLHDNNFIQRYEVRGEKYLEVLNFKKHQKPHVKEAPSLIPAPFQEVASTDLGNSQPLPGNDRGASEHALIADCPTSDSLIVGNTDTHSGRASEFGEPRRSLPPLDNPAIDPNDFEYPLRPLIDAFPTINLTPAAVGHILAEVRVGDEKPWADTIELYVRNHDPTLGRYLPEKVGTLLDVFKKKKQEYEQGKNRNGNTKYSRTPNADALAGYDNL